MNELNVFFIVLYSLFTPIPFIYTLKLIYKDKNKYGWYLHCLFKILIGLSVIPMLFFKDIDIGIFPKSTFAIFFLFLTLFLAIVGLIPTLKKKNIFPYISDTLAAFLEEIIYRGIIFGLLFKISQNIWIAVIISSLLFGLWHMKNYYKSGKMIIWEFMYTALIFGPLFAIARVFTGDIFCGILIHYLINSFFALAPNRIKNKIPFRTNE